MLLPLFDEGDKDLRSIYAGIPGLQRYRIIERHRTMWAYLAETVYQKRFVRSGLSHDYIIKQGDQITHLVEETWLADEGDDNRRFLEITWYPNIVAYRSEFDTPGTLRLLGQSTTQTRHLIREIRQASAEAYCQHLRINPSMRRIIRCFGEGKISVKEMEDELGWPKNTIKDLRSDLTPFAKKLVIPALSTPQKIALWLYLDGLR